MWMTYDTVVDRSTFLMQQLAQIAATLVGFSAFMALSFMAAETLTRRAFGHHPQFWRVWSRDPGSSSAILGRTIGGFLLVSIFFAYDVGLYLIATRFFGWWTPAEALLHPDVLATYVPWLSAIANSLQAGFWEEALFRAVPLAGAALIGDRFGKRNLFLVVAFVVQAIVFGAGHAPYPTQPSYARPVELIIPSIGFGLLYVYFGLLPGIVLHFAFDVIWFALPIFLAEAPGIWFQKAMVVIVTLVPLWVVLWRRYQVGRWTELAPSERNAAWVPPAAPEREAAAPLLAHHGLSARQKTVWLGIGALSLVACVALMFGRSAATRPLTLSRLGAADVARRALESRGNTLGPQWRVLPVPDDGSGGPHEFVSETAGEQRRQELLGVYLPQPRWNVRVATFEGDVAERAEEWRILVSGTGQVRRIQHTLPEGRPGASLDETAARARATAVLAQEFGLDVAKGQAREISARPSRLKARTDWVFTFADTSLPALPQGELRIEVVLAGDEVARTGRFVYVPEDWERRQRATETRSLILRILIGVVFGGLLVSAAVAGIISWSRRHYTPRLFLAAGALMLLVSVINAANGWPSTLAALQTAFPLAIQVAGGIGLGLVALTITSSLVGLAVGALPSRLAASSTLSERDAMQLGIAVGLFGAAASAGAALLAVPAWARTPSIVAMGNYLPIADVAIDPVVAFLTRTAIILSFLAAIDIVTHGWTRRRLLGAAALLLVGFLGAGVPAGSHVGGWFAAGLLLAGALLVSYVTVLRADLTMVPIALAVLMVVAALGRGVQRPFPGALAGSALAAMLLAIVAWFVFRALRRWRAHVQNATSTAAATHAG
jgi:membrane protease YdiL (CAAX protease family)